MTQMPPVNHAPPRSGMSSGAKIALGCSIAALLFMVLICGGLIYLVNFYSREPSPEFTARFETQGYRLERGRVMMIQTPVRVPTVFAGLVLNLEADADADVAISCRVANIEGEIRGNLDIYAQVVTISAQIDGDVNVESVQVLHFVQGTVVTGNVHITSAQSVVVEPGAVIEGELTGNYGMLDNRGRIGSEPPSEGEGGNGR